MERKTAATFHRRFDRPRSCAIKTPKAQIKAIRQKYQPQNDALRAQAKPFMDAARAARQKGDSAAFRTNMEKAHQIMQGASFHTQERAEIRAILTPEQQCQAGRFQDDANQEGDGGARTHGIDVKKEYRQAPDCHIDKGKAFINRAGQAHGYDLRCAMLRPKRRRNTPNLT